MEKYTVSRELAQKLKDADYPQKTIYAWADETKVENAYYFEDIDGYVLLMNKGLLSDYYEYGYQPIAAPLSDELLEQLPQSITKGYLKYRLTIRQADDVPRSVVFYQGEECELLDGGGVLSDDRLPNALAQLWLYCKANELLKPKGSEE